MNRCVSPPSPAATARHSLLQVRAEGAGKNGGGGDRNRTRDILNANQVLYQLSYAPTFVLRFSKTIPEKINIYFRS